MSCIAPPQHTHLHDGHGAAHVGDVAHVGLEFATICLADLINARLQRGGRGRVHGVGKTAGVGRVQLGCLRGRGEPTARSPEGVSRG